MASMRKAVHHRQEATRRNREQAAGASSDELPASALIARSFANCCRGAVSKLRSGPGTAKVREAERSRQPPACSLLLSRSHRQDIILGYAMCALARAALASAHHFYALQQFERGTVLPRHHRVGRMDFSARGLGVAEQEHGYVGPHAL